MGKPFANELRLLPETIKWARDLDLKCLSEIISKYNHPVYIVGSGGSFSACVYAADLLTSKGIFAKAVTPLELFYARPTIRKSNLIFISASGRNTDILFAFKKAIESEPISIINICMRKKTKLTSLSSSYSCCTNFEFDPPAGKDGFLATNSLVTYFVILYKAITNKQIKEISLQNNNTPYLDFINKISSNTCFTILYGSYHHSIAVDIESKFSEAGLAPSLLSDYRHFAHGRHQWFDKRKDSAIIAITCQDDKKLCEKTLDLLPINIPKLILDTSLEDFEGTIELLLQSMELIRQYGIKQGIDPGKPGVPEYGSKIYHLRYGNLIPDKTLLIQDIAIARKAKVDRVTDLDSKTLNEWRNHYIEFIKKISTTKFGSLIFDYDGTLCSPANRFNGMGHEISSMLINFIKEGFVVGVISGRGQSLRKDLEKTFKDQPDLMKNVLIGYYNGSDIAPLTDESHPIKTGLMYPSLKILMDRIIKIGVYVEANPNQLTFGSSTTHEWGKLREILLNEMMLLDLNDITMVESSHSIDIIPRRIASKNNIIIHCQKLCASLNLSTKVLCIGDKGQWPGNDYQLLANEFSLSVGEVSSSFQTGWNICPPSVRDESAVAYIFKKIAIQKGGFKLKDL